MSIQFYTIMHFVGIMAVFLGLGGAIIRSVNGGKRGRMITGITSGVGLLLILVAGFALMAKSGYEWKLWIFIKIGIWILIGALLALINRKPQFGLTLWILLIALGFGAAYVVTFKPGI